MDGDVAYASSGYPVPPLNTVTNARFDDAAADARIATVDRWFRDRELPYTWFVGPADTPPDLGDRLLAVGLEEDPEGSPGMVAPLDGIPIDDGVTGPAVEQVADAATWDVVCDLLVEGFEAPPELGDALRPFGELGFGREEQWRSWLVRVGGEPSGTALGVVEGDALGIFNVATVPAHRRRGAGRAATLAAMRFGAERGCRVAVLQTSPLGRSMYERLGFEPYGDYRVLVRTGWA
jgi:GNAT superfamily N-acetyltransferase